MPERPYVYQMVREAVEGLQGRATNRQIKDYIQSKYGDVNVKTIDAVTITCTVNHTSRIHYPENKKPRRCDTYLDFLFQPVRGRGEFELYRPEIHGVWEIRQDEFGKLLSVRVEGKQDDGILDEPEETATEEALDYSFALEAHLRDFIGRNLKTIGQAGQSLSLFTDETGREGIEYPTGVGPIDILAVDADGGFTVFELKLSRGPDSALGQVLRYMGWIKAHLANGKPVRGVIVAHTIDEKLKYACSLTPDVSLYEYQLAFNIKPVRLKEDLGRESAD
jgi:hypothetical protein